MTTELFCLMLMTVLAASLWIPFIIGVNMLPKVAGAPNSFVVPPNPRSMPPWIARSYRAHQNLLEQFVPFAVVVIVGSLIGVSNGITQWAAIAFVVLRVAHAIGMITAWMRFPVRPVVFTAGYVAVLVLAWQMFADAFSV